MTKKDFIEKIRKSNKAYRKLFGGKCSSICINGVWFFYDCIKLCFDDDFQELFIFDRNRNKIMAGIFYQYVKIDFYFTDEDM